MVYTNMKILKSSRESILIINYAICLHEIYASSNASAVTAALSNSLCKLRDYLYSCLPPNTSIGDTNALTQTRDSATRNILPALEKI